MKRLLPVFLLLGCRSDPSPIPVAHAASTDTEERAPPPEPHVHIRCFDLEGYMVIDTTDIDPDTAALGSDIWRWEGSKTRSYRRITVDRLLRCEYYNYPNPGPRLPCDEPPRKQDAYSRFMEKNRCGNRICSPQASEKCVEGKCVVQEIGWEDNDCGWERKPCPNGGQCADGQCLPATMSDEEIEKHLGLTGIPGTEKP